MIEDIELLELSENIDQSKSIFESVDLSLCSHLTATAEINVCTINLTVEQLFNLKVGSLLVSNDSIESPMTLMINGRAVARGSLISVDDKFAFEVASIKD